MDRERLTDLCATRQSWGAVEIADIADALPALLQELEQVEKRLVRMDEYRADEKAGRIEAEQLEKELREAGREFVKWNALASSYPGHEEYDEAEWLEIARHKDAAQERFEAALAVPKPTEPPRKCHSCGGTGNDGQRDGPCSRCRGTGVEPPPEEQP